MAPAAPVSTWRPYNSLTQAPTNLKEAIDWVLRVTGRDGKKNDPAAAAKQKPPQFSCLCFLAKAIKDLLYDARSPEYPGPSSDRYWDELLLPEESTIVKPVLQDLGLLSTESTTTNSTNPTCAGGTEVIVTLIDQLAQGLQKWVGWQEVEECCLKGERGGESKGIGKKCDCNGGAGVSGCCKSGKPCHECQTCGTTSASKKCYLSAYCKKTASSGGSNGGSNPEGEYYWPSISSDSTKVHLLARIFLGSVCLIWSGLSQLGFLTGGSNRWSQDGILSDETKSLGSFMAAMGYDLERLNNNSDKKTGKFVHDLLTGNGGKDKGVSWKEFQGGSTGKESVAEYYSSIYKKAKSGSKTSETVCKDYPLLVLHILASGYFRAGSAGAKNIIAAKPSQPAPTTPKTTPDSTKKAETPSPRKPRTIREILYWLSALPYSQGYKELVERMGDKYPKKETNPQETEKEIVLHGENSGKTTLLQKDITHYLMAACGYCPLVLIGIQGTINTTGTDSDSATQGPAAAAGDKRCPEHKKDPNAKRCKYDDKKTQEAGQKQGTNELQAGQVCYGGYHLAVSSFGPLHGMYANGLYGFDLGGSAAQCLDQLRVYVYHCFYQLYFLRKQCDTAVLGWKSCRYGSGVNPNAGVSNSYSWICEAQGSGNDCQCKKTAGHRSPLMYFLCDGLGPLVCKKTVGKSSDSETNPYPDIEDHMNKSVDENGKEQDPHGYYPQLCPVPMGWSNESSNNNRNTGTQIRVNHFKDLNNGSHKTENLSLQPPGKYPAHCTGNTLSLLLEYYCDPGKCHGSLVVLLRLLACITPTVPRTLGDLFGFYYYIVYIGGFRSWLSKGEVKKALELTLTQYGLGMVNNDATEGVFKALECYGGVTSASNVIHNNDGSLMRLYSNYSGHYLSPLSGQQYGQLSPLMAGTYLSWLVYLIGGFKDGLDKLKEEFKEISCAESECKKGNTGAGCGGNNCVKGQHGDQKNCCGCSSVVSCTGVLPVLYRYGFGYGNVEMLGEKDKKQCEGFLSTLDNVINSDNLTELIKEINQLIYTTRLPWIFVLTMAWLVAVLYLAFGAIWPLDWTYMRSHCRGWLKKGSLSPWEVLMVGKKKGRGILEFLGGK